MFSIATTNLNWTEETFWESTPRKFIAVRHNYLERENNKLKSIMMAINPNINFEEQEKPQGVYVDNVFF